MSISGAVSKFVGRNAKCTGTKIIIERTATIAVPRTGSTRPFTSSSTSSSTLANRVRDNTLIFDDLDEYLTKARVPYIVALREAQNYVRAYTRGLGIFELPEYIAWPDWDEWEPLTSWLTSKRSQP